MTPAEFANLLGVHIATVYRWESGQTLKDAVQTMQDIADALETSPCALFFADGCEAA